MFTRTICKGQLAYRTISAEVTWLTGSSTMLITDIYRILCSFRILTPSWPHILQWNPGGVKHPLPALVFEQLHGCESDVQMGVEGPVHKLVLTA